MLRQESFSRARAAAAGIGTLVGAGIGSYVGKKKGKELDKAVEERSRKEAEESLEKYIPEAKEKIKNAKLLRKEIKNDPDCPASVKKTLIGIYDDDIMKYQYSIDRLEGKYGKDVANKIKEDYIDRNTIRSSKNAREGKVRGAFTGAGVGLAGAGAGLLALKKLKK